MEFKIDFIFYYCLISFLVKIIKILLTVIIEILKK